MHADIVFTLAGEYQIGMELKPRQLQCFPNKSVLVVEFIKLVQVSAKTNCVVVFQNLSVFSASYFDEDENFRCHSRFYSCLILPFLSSYLFTEGVGRA